MDDKVRTSVAKVLLYIAMGLLTGAWLYNSCEHKPVWLMSDDEKLEEINRNKEIIRERDSR